MSKNQEKLILKIYLNPNNLELKTDKLRHNHKNPTDNTESIEHQSENQPESEIKMTKNNNKNTNFSKTTDPNMSFESFQSLNEDKFREFFSKKTSTAKASDTNKENDGKLFQINTGKISKRKNEAMSFRTSLNDLNRLAEQSTNIKHIRNSSECVKIKKQCKTINDRFSLTEAPNAIRKLFSKRSDGEFTKSGDCESERGLYQVWGAVSNKNSKNRDGEEEKEEEKEEKEEEKEEKEEEGEEEEEGEGEGEEEEAAVELRQKPKSSLRRSLQRTIRNSFRVKRRHSEPPHKKRVRSKPVSDSQNEGNEDDYVKSECCGTVSTVLSPFDGDFEKRVLILQPPAPILIADPPSSEDETVLENLNHVSDPALLNGSSGNFGSAGARSAPSTPQGVLCPLQGALAGDPLSQPCTPGCTSPSIQRSPSHSVFTKCDKASLKQLSTSTPVMTAQAHLTEPPSPKAVKDPKVHTTSKARQKKFLRHFPNIEDDEKVLNHYSCALIGDILLQGHLYITKNYFAFYSNVFGYVTKLLIPILTVENITKEKTARIIPNAVGIATSEDKHVFGSLMSRDSTLQYMRTIWQKAKSASPVIIEPDIVFQEPDLDSSESGESGRDTPPPEIKPRFSLVKKIHEKESSTSQTEADRVSVLGVSFERKAQDRGLVVTLKEAITEFRKLPRQSLILFATTLLLILLFLSAAVLLYRISRIQNRYTIALQDNGAIRESDDIYSDLLQWQSQLHSKSAGAVHSFLDSNLDQIAKVRQSLEALSSLLLQDEGAASTDGATMPLEAAKDAS